MTRKTPEEVMREAEALIEQTRKSLAATADAPQGQGLSDQQRAEAEALFRQDLAAIEREVAEETARLSFANAAPRTGGPRKMRNMI
jgi:hypothetical protein